MQKRLARRTHCLGAVLSLIAVAFVTTACRPVAPPPPPPPPPPPSRIIEYSVPTAHPELQFLSVGPDHNLWFTEYLTNKIVKATTAGVITEYPVPTHDACPVAATAGPPADGRVWFSEEDADQIGVMNTDGTGLHEYPLPSGSRPISIVAGPDNNLWFVEYGTDRIAKMTTGGALTEYQLPTTPANPYGLTVGPDSNLWLTESTGNKVAKVTTSGAITEYSLPSAGSYPIGITTGPDGNLWFAEYGPNSPTQNGTGDTIGVMKTDGTLLHEYPTPTSASGPVDITTGPDGNLWFGEYSTDKVARVTTAGAFTEFAVPTPFGGPYGFVTGPDGNIWFTESLGKIAKIPPS